MIATSECEKRKAAGNEFYRSGCGCNPGHQEIGVWIGRGGERFGIIPA